MKEGLQNVAILIADRDGNHRSALRLLLVNDYHNTSISEAATVESLVELISVSKFNILIIDWNFMRNGAKELISKYCERHQDTFFIVLSTQVENKTAALQAGANAFVYKGDPPEHLSTLLSSYVETAAQRKNVTPSVASSCARPIYCQYFL